MASIGLKINDSSGSGINSGVADVFAKALFGDPEAAAKLALARAQIAQYGASTSKTLSDIDVNKAQISNFGENQRKLQAEEGNLNASAAKSQNEMKLANDKQQAELDAAPGVAEVFRSQLNKPAPVMTPRPPEMMGRMPDLAVVDPVAMDRWQKAYDAAPAQAKAIMLNSGTDPAGQMGKFEGQAGLLTPDPNGNLRTAETLYTGTVPSKESVGAPGDLAGVNAQAALDAANAKLKAPDYHEIDNPATGQKETSIWDPTTQSYIAKPIGNLGLPAPKGPFTGTATPDQEKNAIILAKEKRRAGQPLTPQELDMYRTSYNDLFVPKTVSSRNPSTGQLETSTTSQPLPDETPAPDEINNWSPGTPLKPVPWSAQGGAGGGAGGGQAVPAAAAPAVAAPAAPTEPVAATVEAPGVPTFGPKIATTLQPGTPGTPGGGPGPGAPVPGAPVPGAPVPGAPVPGAPVPGAPVPGAQAVPAAPAPFHAPWATVEDTSTHTVFEPTPGGGSSIRTVSGPKKDPTPNQQPLNDYQHLLESVSALHTLDQIKPGHVPGSLQTLLASLGQTGISDAVLRSFSNEDARSYVRALQTVINGPERRDSGAQVSPIEVQNYVNRYIMPPGGGPKDYAETRTNRMLAALGVRKALDGQMPKAQLDYLDSQLVANDVDLFWGPNAHRMATPEEKQQAINIAGGLPPEGTPKKWDGVNLPAAPAAPASGSGQAMPVPVATTAASTPAPASQPAPRPAAAPVPVAVPAAPQAQAAPAATGANAGKHWVWDSKLGKGVLK